MLLLAWGKVASKTSKLPQDLGIWGISYSECLNFLRKQQLKKQSDIDDSIGCHLLRCL